MFIITSDSLLVYKLRFLLQVQKTNENLIYLREKRRSLKIRLNEKKLIENLLINYSVKRILNLKKSCLF